ncbi:MAG: FAD-dependent oxidoreductase [Chloroflexi bacterium]|nr:FAD-dependent oxidoreductase [Chloroflexota bacterium]
MPKYVIIGNSAGGIGAVEAIRQVDSEGPIAIVSDEPYPAYSRPMISEYLSGETSLERMLFRPRDFYRANGVDTIFGKKVSGIDTKESLVKFANGDTLRYEKLLVATGGVPFVPKTEGGDREGVFTFTTLRDANLISSKLENARSAVVIGGGLIGISVTQALVKRDIDVTIVELKDRILNVLLDEEASRIAGQAVLKAGVKIVTNSTVKQITGQPFAEQAVRSVILDNGDEVRCDLVVMAIGVMPRLDAVADSGIKANRGIVVDRYMTTSVPNVYACGDVAEAYDYVLGINRLTPIWPNAYIGGRIAGFNMAGLETEYAGGTAMNSMNYFGLAIVSAGLVTADGQPDCETLYHLNSETNVYRKVILRDGRIVGMAFVNDIDKSGIVYGLMRDGIDVGSFKRALIGDDFALISLPKDLRKERFGISLDSPLYGDQEDLVEELVLE